MAASTRPTKRNPLPHHLRKAGYTSTPSPTTGYRANTARGCVDAATDSWSYLYSAYTLLQAHGHFLCTQPTPCSSYSRLEVHICWKEPRDDRMEPPAACGGV